MTDPDRAAHERAMDEAAGLVRTLSDVLDDVAAFVHRYVAITPAQGSAIAVWVAHTWVMEAAEATPYLHVTSPVKRAGKSRLLEVVRILVRAPLVAAGTTEAALFRSLAADPPPTLLLDEVDAIFGPKARDNESLRALLNAGYRRGTPVLRCVGDGAKMQVEQFDSFGAKALSGIGTLPDTLADRSLPIRMQRKTRAEKVSRFRVRHASAAAENLRVELRAWSQEQADRLTLAEPDLPDALDDRAQDALEPLFAIAELAGGEWPARARAALVELRGDGDPEDDSAGIRLLADIRTAFGGRDRLASSDLLAILKEDPEAPWQTYGKGGNGLTGHGLGRLLHPFGIRSRAINLGGDERARGFLRSQFDDAFTRWLSQGSPSETVTPLQLAPAERLSPTQNSYADPSVTELKSAANAGGQTVVTGVTDRKPVLAVGPRPRIGQDGYLEAMFSAFESELITEGEWHQAERAHKFVVTAEGAS